jgi:colanic acid/amylovoran biosynthesis glycosyltransferase
MAGGRVAYIATARHGMEAFVYTEVEALFELGADIAIYASKVGPGPYMPKPEWRFRSFRVAELPLSQPRALLRYGRLYADCAREAATLGTVEDFLVGAHYALLMEKDGITHIHCHMGDRKLFVGYYAHRLTGIPLTVTVHAHEMVGSAPKPDHVMFRHALGACREILTISEYNRDFLVEHHEVPREKVRVVRLFTGRERVEKRLRRKKLLLVANMTPKKGHRFLMEALKATDRDDWQLWIVGRPIDLGDRTIDVASMIDELGLGDQISLIGQASDEVLAALFSACDIFCLPSTVEYDAQGGILDQEGIPEVLKEAMTYGKPVVSTHHTGIPELVSEVLVDEHDVAGLSKELSKLLDDPQRWAELGDQNRRKIEEMYTNEDLKVLMHVYGQEAR